MGGSRRRTQFSLTLRWGGAVSFEGDRGTRIDSSLVGGSTGFRENPWHEQCPFSCLLLKTPTLSLWDSGISFHPCTLPQSFALPDSTIGQDPFKNNPWPTHAPTQPIEISHISYSQAAQLQLAPRIALFIFALLPQAETLGDTHQGNHTTSLKYL